MSPIEGEVEIAGGRPAPWLCRIERGKQISGLCLGLATRTELRVDWVRSVAIILGLLTGGLLVLVYLMTLRVVPHFETVEEYHQAIEQGKRW
ncbi:MAG: PspC domain-containing protein [Acidimicrobiaceae bacterium]|nr:PspC domain-containing protein [Acidimicrobiaceae bacterium]